MATHAVYCVLIVLLVSQSGQEQGGGHSVVRTHNTGHIPYYTQENRIRVVDQGVDIQETLTNTDKSLMTQERKKYGENVVKCL